jgi:excisionase family DNA binding protein
MAPSHPDRLWLPYDSLHERHVYCIREIRETLTRQAAEDWSQASAQFSEKLTARQVRLHEGLEVVHTWIFHLRRLLKAMGATHYLPHPDGGFPSPSFPTPRVPETARVQGGAESETSSDLAGHDALARPVDQAHAPLSESRRVREAPRLVREFYSTAEAAEKLGVSASTVYGLVASGKLKHSRVGVRRGVIRISEEQLAEYLQTAEPLKVQLPASPVRLKHLRLS